MPASNATSRFSDRVENYVRYRPGYPPEVLQTLASECGLEPNHVVADIASGTGIWSRMLLENGNCVFGVEPNAEMRGAGERLLARFPKFISSAGTAEATTLADQRVDLVDDVLVDPAAPDRLQDDVGWLDPAHEGMATA